MCFNSVAKFYRRRWLLISSSREHISEILGAVGPHISSLASPVFGTSAKNVQKIRKNPKTCEHFWTLSDVSERVQMQPSRSEQSQHVSELTKTSKSLRKLREYFASFANLARVPSLIVHVQMLSVRPSDMQLGVTHDTRELADGYMAVLDMAIIFGSLTEV